ncbi:MAG: lysylphosphatidylglycerol synthase transmembrane domain-containing protein [Candidatus Omnitrophota bacterium]
MLKKIAPLIRIFISFGLLVLLFWIMRRDAQGIVRIISDCDFKYIFIAAGLILVNVVMLSYRFKIIFLGENLTVNLWEALQLTLIGYFFNNFMPTAVGGDIVKGHYASIFTDNKRLKAFASVLMDRFIGLYTFLVVAAAAVLIDRGRSNLSAVRPLVILFLTLGVVVFFIAVNRSVARWMEKIFRRFKMFRLGERLNAVYNIVHDYRNRKDVILKSFLISVISQSIYFVAIYFFFLALGKTVSLGNIFLVMPVVTFVSMIPSIGGLGVREGAIVAFFAPMAGKEEAFAVSLLVLSGLIFMSLLGGIVYLWWGMSGTLNRVRDRSILDHGEEEFTSGFGNVESKTSAGKIKGTE